MSRTRRAANLLLRPFCAPHNELCVDLATVSVNDFVHCNKNTVRPQISALWTRPAGIAVTATHRTRCITQHEFRRPTAHRAKDVAQSAISVIRRAKYALALLAQALAGLSSDPDETGPSSAFEPTQSGVNHPSIRESRRCCEI
jgi:hypothetical protein